LLEVILRGVIAGVLPLPLLQVLDVLGQVGDAFLCLDRCRLQVLDLAGEFVESFIRGRILCANGRRDKSHGQQQR